MWAISAAISFSLMLHSHERGLITHVRNNKNRKQHRRYTSHTGTLFFKYEICFALLCVASPRCCRRVHLSTLDPLLFAHTSHSPSQFNSCDPSHSRPLILSPRLQSLSVPHMLLQSRGWNHSISEQSLHCHRHQTAPEKAVIKQLKLW